MDDPTSLRRMTRGLSRALSSGTAGGGPTPKASTGTATAERPAAPPPLGERTDNATAAAPAAGGGAAAVPGSAARPALSPLLPGADTTPPFRLAPEAMLPSPPGRLPFAAVEVEAGPPPPSAAIPPGLLRAARAPGPSSLADLLASPYTPVGDDGEVVGGSRRRDGASPPPPPSTIPAYWPRPGERDAARRSFEGAGTAAAAPPFPPKSVVVQAPDGGGDRAGVAALQAEVRRALTAVGVAVPPQQQQQRLPHGLPVRRAREAGGGGEAAAPTPPPRAATRRLTALEAALGGLGLGMPGGRWRRGS